jgi:SOS-response transcriptional repressor LexA
VIEENALFFEPRTGDVGPSAFGLVVDNDAMAPVIPHGATLVVDPDAPLAPGAYVVAMSTQLRAVIVRRLRMPSPAAYPIELRAENADHPDVTLRSEADGMVIGRAVRVIHTI